MASYKFRILLNAEPFGFGPAAAIASTAHLLATQNISLGYIGEAHTHDLQRTNDYSERYDITGLSPVARRLVWEQLAKTYEVFMTAMDFRAAEEAKNAGMRVIIYDALAWYWPSIPDIVAKAELYLAQDFFGVRSRLKSDITPYTDTKLVPPLTTICKCLATADRNMILLNMGGLQNPNWSSQDAINYATVMVEVVKSAFPNERLCVATSHTIASALKDPLVKTFNFAQIQRLLCRTKIAIMTPGLGNIYDSAAHSIPTLWLPPANDSQGRQLDLLRQYGVCDSFVSWEELGVGLDLTLPQSNILGMIASNVNRLKADRSLVDLLSRNIDLALAQLSPKICRSAQLLQRFGSAGSSVIADEILAFVQRSEYVSV